MDTCTGILSIEQLQDIHFKRSGLVYGIINGELIFKTNSFDLYIDMFAIVKRMLGVIPITNIWLSDVPCAICIDYLTVIMDSIDVYPVLNIESLKANGSKYAAFRELGCLAKLSAKGFPVKAWDWNMFHLIYGQTCDYSSTANFNTQYRNNKFITENFLNFLTGCATKDILAKLCV